MRNVPYRVSRSTVGGADWGGGLGGTGLLEEVSLWGGWALIVHSFSSLSIHSLLCAGG